MVVGYHHLWKHPYEWECFGFLMNPKECKMDQRTPPISFQSRFSLVDNHLARDETLVFQLWRGNNVPKKRKHEAYQDLISLLKVAPSFFIISLAGTP